MNHVQPDPVLESNDPIVIEDYIRKAIGNVGASVGEVIIRDSIDIDSEVLLKARREMALQDHPDEDPDLRFPTFDVRNEKIRYRTANANRNILRMHRAIQSLWASAVKWEEEESFNYDFVFFLRDDALWLSDFNLNPFISMRSGDFFTPSCDARDQPMDSNELNDYIVISRRSAVGTFGNFYSKLFDIDPKACMGRLSQAITKNGSRGCNSEMLLKWVTDEDGLKVKKISQDLLPFQRSVNIKLPSGSNRQCFHKFCQSKFDPWTPTPDNAHICRCDSIEWKDLFAKEK
jgi:hypothetical protein